MATRGLLPVVLEDLHLTASDAQRLNASYCFMFAALLITVGRMGDLRARHPECDRGGAR